MNEAVTVTSFNLFSSKYSSPQKFPYTDNSLLIPLRKESTERKQNK